MVTNYLTKKGGEEKQQILVTQLKPRSGHKSDGKTCGTWLFSFSFPLKDTAQRYEKFFAIGSVIKLH